MFVYESVKSKLQPIHITNAWSFLVSSRFSALFYCYICWPMHDLGPNLCIVYAGHSDIGAKKIHALKMLLLPH